MQPPLPTPLPASPAPRRLTVQRSAALVLAPTAALLAGLLVTAVVHRWILPTRPDNPWDLSGSRSSTTLSQLVGWAVALAALGGVAHELFPSGRRRGAWIGLLGGAVVGQLLRLASLPLAFALTYVMPSSVAVRAPELFAVATVVVAAFLMDRAWVRTEPPAEASSPVDAPLRSPQAPSPQAPSTQPPSARRRPMARRPLTVLRALALAAVPTLAGVPAALLSDAVSRAADTVSPGPDPWDMNDVPARVGASLLGLLLWLAALGVVARVLFPVWRRAAAVVLLAVGVVAAGWVSSQVIVRMTPLSHQLDSPWITVTNTATDVVILVLVTFLLDRAWVRGTPAALPQATP